MHEDEDDDHKPFARPTTRKEPLQEGRDQVIDDENLAPWFLRDLLRTNRDTRESDQMATSNCKPGTTSVEGFARMRRRDLDLGQKVRR